MDTMVARGLVTYRWASWLWMAVVAAISLRDMLRPWVGAGLVALALAVNVWTTVAIRRRPAAVFARRTVLVELAVGSALVLGDGWAFGGGHAFSASLSLGSVWPVAGVLSAGVAVRSRPGDGAEVCLHLGPG